MNRSTQRTTLIVLLLVCVLLNVVVFLTVGETRQESVAFWVAWAFTFPWSLLVTLAGFLLTGRGNNALRAAVTLRINCMAFLAYLLPGLLLMYLPIDSLLPALIIGLGVVAAHLLAVSYFTRTVSRMASDQQRAKQQAQYVRGLSDTVEQCIAEETDAALLAALQRLADRLRFSDPAAHTELEEIEQALFDTVAALPTALAAKDATAAELVARASDLLEQRNQRCKMLK